MNPQRIEVAMSTATQTTQPPGVKPAETDWFSLACKILAPGTKHHNTNTVAIDWDSFDKLEGHGWEYKAWWVGPDGRRVETHTQDAHLHEQRTRKLLDGSSVTCFPPSHLGRPGLMLCATCAGRGWTLRTDEDGDPAQVQCRDCHADGTVPRPFSPLPFDLQPEDLTGPEPATPTDVPY